jgi:hypothetical protein
VASATTIGGVEAATQSPLRCVTCEYDLTGLAPTGVCPECGHRVDDSMRERGLWTVARLLRLRRIAIGLLTGAIVWLIMAIAIALEFTGSTITSRPPQQFVECCAIVTVLGHTAAIAFGAIGGTFASSRHSYRVRMGISAGLSAVLVVAACCLSGAIAGSQPLQQSFEDWGFAASAAVRTAGIATTLLWLTLGLRQTALADWTRRRVLSFALVAYPIAWSMLIAALILPPTSRWLSSMAGERVLAGVLALDGIALLAIGMLAVSCVLSPGYVAEVTAAARRAPASSAACDDHLL